LLATLHRSGSTHYVFSVHPFIGYTCTMKSLRFKLFHDYIFENIRYNLKNRNSSGGIVSDYGLDDRDSIPDRGKGFFLALASKPALGSTQSPIQWVPRVLSPGGKARPGGDADHSPHLVPRLSVSRSYNSSPPMRLHDM
jgi:hypothetical protein